MGLEIQHSMNQMLGTAGVMAGLAANSPTGKKMKAIKENVAQQQDAATQLGAINPDVDKDRHAELNQKVVDLKAKQADLKPGEQSEFELSEAKRLQENLNELNRQDEESNKALSAFERILAESQRIASEPEIMANKAQSHMENSQTAKRLSKDRKLNLNLKHYGTPSSRNADFLAPGRNVKRQAVESQKFKKYYPKGGNN